MYQLDEQQLSVIYERLRKERISSRKLEEDLLDHFCCCMEARMAQGMSFEEAYREAADEIAPNGIKELDFELFFLMNFHKQLSMKKLIFLLGFLALFSLSVGLMFHILHWQGAQVILISGFALLLLTTLVTCAYLLLFSRRMPASFWWRTLSGLTAVFLVALGFIFKNFHFTGANVLYGLGTILLNFIFLPLFFYHTYKSGLVKS